MILGLFTKLFEPGGIQRINQHTGAVLEGFAREQGRRCLLLSLNDTPGLHSFVVGNYECKVRGFGGKKSKFIAQLLSVASKVRLAYIGHLNLAPLGLLLRLANSKSRYWVATYGVEVWYPLSLWHRLSLRMAHRVTALSRFTAERIVETGRFQAQKVVVVPPALEPGFTNVDAKTRTLSVPTPKRIILTVGRFISTEPGKGVDTLIRALPNVLRTVPETLCMVVGDGDRCRYLQELAVQVDVTDHVVFAGKKMGDDLKEFYREADVFAMPSRQEGFGVVFLEAMAFAKPVIGGNHGGTPEVVVDGMTGFLVEYGEVDALADRLIRLLQDEGLRKRMGEAGRRRVEENYTFEHFRERLSGLLNGK